jgi:hypothetical protein
MARFLKPMIFKLNILKSAKLTGKGLFCIWFFFNMQSPVFAQEASLSIKCNNTRDHLLAYVQLNDAFQEKITKAVLSGVSTSFWFHINLHQARSLLMDKEISDIQIIHTVKYDNLKKKFTVHRSWDGDQPKVTQSLKEAQELMTEIDGLKVVELKRLEKGNRYHLKAKAEMSKLRLPFYLHYIFLFVSIWDFETDWYTLEFVY